MVLVFYKKYRKIITVLSIERGEENSSPKNSWKPRKYQIIRFVLDFYGFIKQNSEKESSYSLINTYEENFMIILLQIKLIL